MHPTTFRPTYLSIEREAAAAAANVDVLTYNLMMDLQHRDITPEDYDTLRRACPLLATTANASRLITRGV